MFTVNCNAQSSIGSFYGMKLGDTKESVVNGVRSQGKTGVWKTSKNGNPYYLVTNPKLGSCTFKEATFSMNNGKLSSACFISYTGGAMSTIDLPGIPSGYPGFLRTAENYENIFQTMKNDFIYKYGRPVINSDEKCVWRSGKNEILLGYELIDEETAYSGRNVFVKVYVQYQIINSSNSNY